MYIDIVYKPTFSLRPIHCIFVVVGLFFAQATAFAQRAADQVAKPGMERIDQEEGARRLEAFRQQRLEGDYVFEFQLEHKPRESSRTIRYDGIMWGSWNEQGAVTRFKILPLEKEGEATSDLVELIVQSGPSPSAWKRRGAEEDFQKVDGEALFEPLLPGLVYSIFDLQMPFIYWDDFVYEGPTLIGASRVGQQFLMLPPKDAGRELQDIQGVRVSLDDTYNALWRIEVINTEEDVRSKFAVRSFKKVQEQYIVKKIELTEYPSKDSTSFHVTEASVGLKLDRKLFELPKVPSLESGVPSCCNAQ